MAAEEIKERVIAALRTCYDPEIPVNIYDLGLIYELNIDEAGMVEIKMTLTAPGCPVAASFPGVVAGRVRGVEGVADVTVELVWDPPWNQGMMIEQAKLQLGLM